MICYHRKTSSDTKILKTYLKSAEHILSSSPPFACGTGILLSFADQCIFSKFFALNLSECQPPFLILYSAATPHLTSIHLTHFLPKQFPVSIYIVIHLPTKLFIYLLSALIYTPFNLSVLFSLTTPNTTTTTNYIIIINTSQNTVNIISTNNTFSKSKYYYYYCITTVSLLL